MTGNSVIPVIIGVSDVKNKPLKLEDGLEPMQLMLQAILLALRDTGLKGFFAEDLQSAIDSIDVVATWTWAYPDLPGLLAENLGVQARYKFYSEHGGNQPAKLLDEAARRISLGQSQVAVVTGGEALASLSAFASAGKLPPRGWAKQCDSSSRVEGLARLESGMGAAHSIGLPIHVYPLYENGFRAFRGQLIQQNNEESARLYANFAEVAAKNPVAWNYGSPPASEEIIGKATKKNRMICFPYPLLMNAFNNVNLASACILTSTEYARELGVPDSKWIYPLGGAGTRDSYDFWDRPNFYSSPALSRSLDAGLLVSGLTSDQIDLFDFYSCFPIVPKIACYHLGLPIINPPKPITLLGGLTSFGGAGNNYSMHAITEMVRQLREGDSKNGLVLANGGVLTYQHVICLSSQPRNDGSPYPEAAALPDIITDVPTPHVDRRAEGEAVIETYTVEFSRDGTPLRGHIVGRLRNGHRFVSNHGDETTLRQLSSASKEQIGRNGWVRRDSKSERNLFSFKKSAQL